eukprot:scaffold10022_cov170-Amphora_coffeaeformis.AAC.14
MQKGPFHLVDIVFATFATPRIEHGANFGRFHMRGNPNIETALGHGRDAIVRKGVSHLDAGL